MNEMMKTKFDYNIAVKEVCSVGKVECRIRDRCWILYLDRNGKDQRDEMSLGVPLYIASRSYGYHHQSIL